MKKVGILVGHFGPGTGAVAGGRDEWCLAMQDAARLAKMFRNDGLVQPVLISVNQDEHPWDLVQAVSPISFLGRWGNIEVRYQWAMRELVDLAVELHINANSSGTAEGHEVFIQDSPGPRTSRLGQLLINSLDEFLEDHPHRGLKRKGFRILRKLHAANIPAALIEPAFITEECLGLQEWREKYVRAITMAVYRFFN